MCAHSGAGSTGGLRPRGNVLGARPNVSTGLGVKTRSAAGTFPRGRACAPVETFYGAPTWKRLSVGCHKTFPRGRIYPDVETLWKNKLLSGVRRKVPTRFHGVAYPGHQHSLGNVFTGAHCPDLPNVFMGAHFPHCPGAVTVAVLPGNVFTGAHSPNLPNVFTGAHFPHCPNVHEYSVLLCKLVDPCNLLFYLGARAQYLGIIVLYASIYI